ncbi:hypothetical protein CLAFUW4_10545 [Fulvia fulva]|uniref:MARVEL domain-containing protein n=1 Tax=Passalora fulva TaxID=5499 RepID=A0A9Q8P888_PASFU|nr:uncharacterized protein CLAFUR5_05159 [Fulvia fulva]KAK4615802.1 hypothetical protein CLAFUR4_10550 [Fulvia fulva]KAK4616994.1 hypothetical protein CLAFUR0_10694 [Fulvia fulva]UJO16858.1 hypothetical protein CLAFUR5_05159 [Fulvia fulva]WPV18912.1 hypothetical protein CLAFUW4_10545 [Fulvia fulva]WPV34034.1 hypothetical protein CLAFUW7_10547 [Fulvia fulva]
MEKGRIGLLVTRALQFICAAAVLGVGVKLARGVHEFDDDCKAYAKHDRDCNDALGRFPSSLAYAAFTGAFGLLDALVGLAAVFISAVPWIAVLALDALAAVFFLAGGINSAILRSKDKYRNEGRCDLLSGFCGRFDATTALMFIGFLTTLGAMAMGFFSRRSGNRHSAV